MASASSLHGSEEKCCCPICFGDFKLPRQLWCMHTFCQGCLQDFINSQVNQVSKLTEFSCPICKKVTHPSDEDKPTSVWATLFPLNTILQAPSGNPKSKVDQLCEACNTRGVSSSAVCFCFDCIEGMCETCEGVHRGLKLCRNHTIISMEEFINDPQTVMKFAEGFDCPEHDDKEVKFYCRDHKIACCGTCSVVRHRSCSNVSELKKELFSLLQGLNPDNIIDQMRKLETHLCTFIKVNESNVSILETQVINVTTQISELRKKLNDTLDQLERRVKTEGNRIYKEEMIRKHRENHECESLINAIRNSRTHLEAVKKYGTDTQLFLTMEKMTPQLTSYIYKIREKYQKTQTLTIRLEIDSQLISLPSIQSEVLVKCVESIEDTVFNLPGISVPLKEYSRTKTKCIELQFQHENNPSYIITCLPNGQVILADHANLRVCLLDLSYNLITSYTTPEVPYDICMTNHDQVALLYQQTIQFISVRDSNILPSRKITTRYRCSGIAAARNGDFVVSGYTDTCRFCWSRINSAGDETLFYQYDTSGYIGTSIALDACNTRVYVSVFGLNGLFCFNFDGSKKFVYSPDNLRGPCGVSLDRDNNIYVVGQESKNIHQLSPDAAVLRIISTHVPKNPICICFTRDYNRFYITSNNSKTIFISTALADR